MSAGRRGSRRVYSGRIINLDIDTVEFPDGSQGELEMLRHPGASAVLPFLDEPESDDPTILLIRQYRYAADGFLYEIPAGRLDAGEDPATCAARELREETGYTATTIRPLVSVFTTPGFTDERIHLFEAFGLTAGDAAREADEFLSLEPTSLSRAVEMVGKGQLIDGKTVCAVLFAASRRWHG